MCKKGELAKRVRRYLNVLWSRKKIYIYRWPLAANIPKIALDGELHISHLQSNEIKSLMTFHDNYYQDYKLFSTEDVVRRLDIGHLCFLIRHGEELVAFLWFAVRENYSPDLHCIFKASDHSVITYNGLVRTDLRGKNIFPWVMAKAFCELSRAGYVEAFGYNHSANTSSLRATAKLGARTHVGTITCGYFLGYYFFLPKIKQGAGVKVYFSGSPWHRYKGFLSRGRLRFG